MDIRGPWVLLTNSKVISDLQLYGIERSRIELDYLVAVICLFFLCHLIQLAAVTLLFVSTYKNLMTWEFVKNCEATKPSPISSWEPVHSPQSNPTPTGWGIWTAQSQTGFAPEKHLGGWWGGWMGSGVGSLVDLRLPIPKMLIHGWPDWALLMKRC